MPVTVFFDLPSIVIEKRAIKFKDSLKWAYYTYRVFQKRTPWSNLTITSANHDRF